MRTKSAIKIIASSVILQVVVAIAGLILPRLLIEKYGSEVNGLVSSIKQIITYFSIVSMGLGAASAVALYKPLEQKDTEEISAVLSATRIFFNRTGYLFGSLVLVLSIIYPLLVKSNLEPVRTALIIFILGMGGISEYILVSKYRIVLIADQKNYIVSWITTQGVIINIIISVILIYMKAPIEVIIIASTAVYLLRLVTTKNYVKRLYPKVNYFAKPNFTTISGRWDAFGYQLPSMIIEYTPIILVTFFLGLNETSIYSIYYLIYSSIAMIVGIFSAGINASFGNVLVKADKNILNKSYDTFSYIIRIITFGFYTTAFILTIPFINIYIVNADGVNYIIPSIAFGFAVSGLFKNIRIAPVTLVEAAGRFKENKLQNIIEAAVNVLLSIILVKIIGITGILIASGFTGLIRSVIYIVYTNRYILFKSSRTDLVNIFVNIILVSLIIFTSNNIMKSITISNYIEWIILAIVTTGTVFSTVIITNSILCRESAKDVVKRVKKLINNVRTNSIK